MNQKKKASKKKGKVSVKQKFNAKKYKKNPGLNVDEYRHYKQLQSLAAQSQSVDEEIYNLKKPQTVFEEFLEIKGNKYYYTPYGYYDGTVWNSKKNNITIPDIVKGFLKVNTFQNKGIIYSKPIIQQNIPLENRSYHPWSLEHVMDTSSILNSKFSPILRNLYGFKSVEDISEFKEPLITLVDELQKEKQTVIIILPDDNNNFKNITQIIDIDNNNIELQPNSIINQMKLEFNKRNPDKYYIQDGTILLWYKKIRAIFRYYELNLLIQNNDTTANPYYLLKLMMEFIKLIKVEFSILAQRVKNIIQNIRPLIKENNLIEISKRIIYEFVPVLFQHRQQMNLKQHCYLINNQNYIHFLDSFKAYKLPISIIAPLNILNFTIYSDGSSWEYYTYDYKIFNRSLPTLGSFAGILLTSTQHIVTTWRYRVKKVVLDSYSMELYGVLFSILLAIQLKVPIVLRCDSSSVLGIIHKVITQKFESLVVKRMIKKDPKIEPIFQIIAEANITHFCKLEWTRSHSNSPLNVLTDRLASISYFTADIINISEFFNQARQLAEKVNLENY